MNKTLFFIAALVAPGLAYGADISAPLSGQIVPAGSDPAVPAPAAAAGFTTLLLDADFTNGQICVSGSCVAASPVTNWLDCAGTDNTKAWHKDPSKDHCTASISVNSLIGQNALAFPYLASWGLNSTNGIMTAMGFSGPGTPSFPQGAYVEVIYRLSTTWSGGTGGPNDVFLWQYNTPCIFDFQPGELYPETNGFGGGNSAVWCGPSGRLSRYTWRSYHANNLPPGWVPTQYHTYAALSTTNGIDSVVRCAYVDDVLQASDDAHGCFNLWSFQAVPHDTSAARTFLVTETHEPSPGTATDLTLWIQRIRVWTCSGGATGQCNGSTFVGTLGNGAVAYWH